MLDFILIGKAARAGFAVELPEVCEKWGKEAVAVENSNKTPYNSVIENAVTNHFGCKLYMTKFRVAYKISQKAVDAASDLGSDLFSLLFGTTDDPTGEKAQVT